MCTSVKVKDSYCVVELTSSIIVIENRPPIGQEKIIIICECQLMIWDRHPTCTKEIILSILNVILNMRKLLMELL